MKTRFVVPFILCVFMTIGSAGAVWGGTGPESKVMFLFTDSPYESLYRMDEMATALYGAANDNNRQYAYVQIQKLQKGIASEMLRYYGHEEGWDAIAADLKAIELVLARGSSNTEWREYAARVRLAFDAVIGGSGSLWYQYERLLREDVRLVGQALKRSTDDRLAAADAADALLTTMQAHVNRMETAAIMTGHSLRVEELRQRMAYSVKMIDSLKKEEGNASKKGIRLVEESLDGTALALDHIFRSEENADPVPVLAPPSASHPLQWTFFLGTMISAVLTYVGWRKYKQTPYGIKSIK
ncbi:sporulation protein YpjB [Paenibacillus sp. LHD-117]|uniref:sporulation protein YpjB n=1 Tax=Paenibacillus sp. LHD-117 TaxID=3071412 RepID=UPI0027E116D7|nr:sporulation protein YpjB [Paenibacillus sp. LHD-117]MDQ6418206.1 sporulation protein YpjB [Paenibacillus sp. LHD-117]